MADTLREVFGLFFKRYRDMQDGSKAEVLDIGDRAARELGAVTVGDTVDIGDRAARDLGNVDVASIKAGDTHFGEVGGSTAIAEAAYTRPADTTQYAAGDQVADSTSAPTALEFEVARTEGGTGVIVDALCISSANKATKPDLRLYLFDTEPTPSNDNAAWAPSDEDMANLIGVVEFSSWHVGSAAADAAGNCASLVKGLNLPFDCLAGSQLIYGLLVERATYTPVSEELLTVRLGALQD